MTGEYKKIVLLKGLELMNVYQFRTIKSLLRKDLKLTEKLQAEYDRIQIADLMEDTFPTDAGLDKLIQVCELKEDLEGLAAKLKEERAKVKKQNTGKCKTAMKKSDQVEPSSSQTLSANSESNKNNPSSKKKRNQTTTKEGGEKRKQTTTAKGGKKGKQTTRAEGGKKRKLTQEQTQLPEPTGIKDEGCLQAPHKPPPTPSSSSSNKKQKTPTIKKHSIIKTEVSQEKHQLLKCLATSNSPDTPKRGIIPKEPAKEEGHQQGPKQVMVLKVTEPFTYDLKEDKRMFHATVATETEFFRVKIFDVALKSKFIPKKTIVISDYFGCNGFLEIHQHSCVSDEVVNQKMNMNISKTLRQRANATPKISHLFSQTSGTFVSGEFVVIKKTERNTLIYYEIEDDTGKMEVVVYGRLTNIKCEPGSKLRLVCFELTSSEDKWQLRSSRHSYMQVINPRM